MTNIPTRKGDDPGDCQICLKAGLSQHPEQSPAIKPPADTQGIVTVATMTVTLKTTITTPKLD